ncbi:MAG: hypothetical protein K0U45_10175 [Alphaproteobacteria bacterium]|nr:hypothetical protein [Alphaproteobacteria bacterium]
MSSDITLSSAQRSTLVSLKQTSKLSDRTQVRLATGNRINDVTDGAEGFFSARALDNRAEILLERRGGIDQGLSTLQATLDGIDALDELLGQLRGLVRQARSQSAVERQETTRSYENVVEQFRLILNDTTYQGVNLLNNTQTSLSIEFSDRDDSDIDINGVNILASIASDGGIFNTGLLSNIRNINTGFPATPPNQGLSQGFSVLSNANSLLAVDELERVLSDAQERLETRANSLGNNVAILQTRIDFTDSVSTELIAGADKITTADLNEEAANYTAIGTQYQIGVQSLATSAQRLQALLQVIR